MVECSSHVIRYIQVTLPLVLRVVEWVGVEMRLMLTQPPTEWELRLELSLAKNGNIPNFSTRYKTTPFPFLFLLIKAFLRFYELENITLRLL